MNTNGAAECISALVDAFGQDFHTVHTYLDLFEFENRSYYFGDPLTTGLSGS
jgi:hypothetical protein